MPDRLILIRHAESTFNKMQNLRNTHPIYLSFRKAYDKNPHSLQARKLAEKAKNTFFIDIKDSKTALAHDAGVNVQKMAKKLKEQASIPDVIFVSPSDRTSETLKHMIGAWQDLASVPVIRDERIRERDQGLAYQYGDWRIYHALHPEEIEKKKEKGDFHYDFPKGESIASLNKRVSDWIAELEKEHKNKNIMVISHKKTILSIRMILEGLSEEDFFKLNNYHGPINSGVSVYERKNKKLILKSYNIKLY